MGRWSQLGTLVLSVFLASCRPDAAPSGEAAPAAPASERQAKARPAPARAAEARAPETRGTPDADTLVGTDGDDVIEGGAGDDLLQGEGGDDVLIGGEGADVIEGGDGDDLIYGDGGPDAAQARAASRFLAQAGFGGSKAEIYRLAAMGEEAWFREQAALPQRSVLERFEGLPSQNGNYLIGLWWERAVFAEDQLRQRVAYALSQITVVSRDHTPLRTATTSYAAYLDHLERQALGNYEDLIQALAFDPAMGLWLSHIANRKADGSGNAPDENFARELLQLFTIGTVPLDAEGRALTGEAFTNEDVEGLAAVMTGLSWADQPRFQPWLPDLAARSVPMQAYPSFHETEPKTFLGATISGSDVEASVREAMGVVLGHPNVPPFVSTRLIERLTSSNPSPAYVGRVATAYRTGRFALPTSGVTVGAGRRGDLTATVAASLFDEEARAAGADGTRGKLREPALRFAQLLRAYRRHRPESTDAAPGPLIGVGRSSRVGQAPLRAPSVFNFYQSGHRAPGSATAASGLASPELQIATSARAAGYAGYMLDVTSERGMNGFMEWDFDALAALADDAAAVADELDLVLVRGGMSDAVRARIQAGFDAFPMRAGQEDAIRLHRVRFAIALVMTSQEFAVER